jgi:hypothetical protein
MSFSVDWQSVFIPGIGIPEVIIRGSIMHLCMFDTALCRAASGRSFRAGRFAGHCYDRRCCAERPW